MQNRIETSCLIFRPFDLSDARVAFEWFGDPIVMKFTPTGPEKPAINTPLIGANFLENVSGNGRSFGVPEQIERIACNGAKRSLFAKNTLIPF